MVTATGAGGEARAGPGSQQGRAAWGRARPRPGGAVEGGPRLGSHALPATVGVGPAAVLTFGPGRGTLPAPTACAPEMGPSQNRG